MIPLFTSHYRASVLIGESGLVPVGISIGAPKFPIDYALVFMRTLAPWGLLQVHDHSEFRSRYIARLDTKGVEPIRADIERISRQHDGRGLVLLCFEKPGAFCHRRLFAEWWERQTFEQVPELCKHLQAETRPMTLFDAE